jgi:hypothetical protein
MMAAHATDMQADGCRISLAVVHRGFSRGAERGLSILRRPATQAVSWVL